MIEKSQQGILFKSGNYIGEIENGVPNGIGALTYPGAHMSEGEWNDGVKHGQGTFTFSDGGKVYREMER